MTMTELVDASGAVRAYLASYPGLMGPGGAIVSGLHPGKPNPKRSPSAGAIAGMEVTGPRSLSDVSDDFRVLFTVGAVGGEQGPRELVEAAVRALARAVLALQDGQAVVQTRRGEWVRLLVAGDPAGPTEAGDLGGEFSMVLDVLFRAQESGAPYGAGAYGAGPYGG